MSLCDGCYSPGACCKRLRLYREEDGQTGYLTFWDDTPVQEQTKDWDDFPFVPLDRVRTDTDAESGRTYSTWEFSCPKLLPSGRCGDYENRPALCRRYEPGSDPLCVHYQGAEGTGDGL